MNLNINSTNEEKIDVNCNYTFCQTQRFFSFTDLKIRYIDYVLNQIDNNYFLYLNSELNYYPLQIFVGSIKFTLISLNENEIAIYKSSKLC